MCQWDSALQALTEKAKKAGQATEELKLILREAEALYQAINQSLPTEISPEIYDVNDQMERAENLKKITSVKRFSQDLCLYIIQLQFTQFNASLQLKNHQHHQLILDSHELIFEQIKQLHQSPQNNKLDVFKTWFDEMMLTKQKDFSEDPKIWHEIIRPVLLGLLGMIVTVLTLVFRPFVHGVSSYANSFFKKPDPEGFKVLQAENLEITTFIDQSILALSA